MVRRESFFTGLLYNIRDCKVEEKEEEKLKKIKNNEQKISNKKNLFFEYTRI